MSLNEAVGMANTVLLIKACTCTHGNMVGTHFLAPLKILFFAILMRPKFSHDDGNWKLNKITISSSLVQQNCGYLTGAEAFLSSVTSIGVTIFDRRQKLLIIFLLLCGDVSTNPGPNWKFPCGICDKPVKTNQRGILSDPCDTWIHSRCIDLDDSEFNRLANSSCSWLCPNCDSSNFTTNLPVTGTLDSFSSTNNFDILGNDNNVDQNKVKSSTHKKHSGERSSLSVLLVNCQSLRNKVADLATVIEERKPDIILLINRGYARIFSRNYSVFRKDRVIIRLVVVFSKPLRRILSSTTEMTLTQTVKFYGLIVKSKVRSPSLSY